MASGSRKPLSEFARFQYNFETSFVVDALLDPILSQLPLRGLETDCIDPRVLAQIDPLEAHLENFPREMLLLGDDIKEEDGQAEKENIPSFKRMKSDHSKIQFGKASKGFIRLPQSESTGRISLCSPACRSLLLKIFYTSAIISQFVVSANISYWQCHISNIGIAVPLNL